MNMRSPWLPSLWSERKGDIDPFRSLRSQLDDLFQDFTGGMSRLSALPEGTFPLRVDVCETPEALTIKADLPGVEQKDVDISITGDEITISAEKKSETSEENGGQGSHLPSHRANLWRLPTHDDGSLRHRSRNGRGDVQERRALHQGPKAA